jgi:hypothetical protein
LDSDQGHLEHPICLRHGRLWMAGEDRIIVPESVENRVIQIVHSANGHQGMRKTIQLFRRTFFVKGLDEKVRLFINRCEPCQLHLRQNAGSEGLHPLPVPLSLMEDVAMDFLKVPELVVEGKRFDTIWLIVDRLSRFIVTIPTNSNLVVEEAVQLFLDRVVAPFGCPRSIVSDQDKLFTADIWKGVCNSLGIVRKMTVAGRPQADGISERQHQSLLQVLRKVLAERKSEDWLSHLQLATAMFNGTFHSATGCSPFFVVFGREWVSPLDSLGLIPRADGMDAKVFLKRMSDTQNEVRSHLDKYAENMRSKSTVTESSPLKVGQRVWIKKDREGKLDACWSKGIIKSVLGKGAYQVETGSISKSFNRDHIRPMGEVDLA